MTSTNAGQGAGPTSQYTTAEIPPRARRFILAPDILNAALESDARSHTANSGTEGGLPPPPRPVSARRQKTARSVPVSPVASVEHAGESSARPSPRLSHLLREEEPRMGDVYRTAGKQKQKDRRRETRDGEMDAPGGETDGPADDGADGTRIVSPVEMSAETSAETSVVRDVAQRSRHTRYLPSLPKIKMLGKGKSMSGDYGRAGEEVVDEKSSGSSKKSGDGGRYRRMLVSGGRRWHSSAHSVPSSPIAGDVFPELIRSKSKPKPSSSLQDALSSPSSSSTSTSPLASSTRPSLPSSPSPLVYTSDTADRPSLSPTSLSPSHSVTSPFAFTFPRPLLSHARQPSDMSTASSFASRRSPLSLSDDSHDPPSTFTDARISISSTIYQDSSNHHSFDNSCYRTTSSSMSPDRESFIDLASPALSPRSPDFSPIRLPPLSFTAPFDLPITTPDYSTDDLNVNRTSQPSSNPRLPPITPTTRAATTPASIKPPIPTTPKPSFKRSKSAQPPPDRSPIDTNTSSKPDPLSRFASDMTQFLPPTTNRLNPRERAEGVRKTRKLTQLFGQTPGVSPVSSPDPDDLDIAIASGCLPVPSNLALNLKKHKLHRAAVSMSNDVVTPVQESAAVVWPSADGARYVPIGARRHSTPMSPQEFSFRASRASAESALSQNASTLDRDPSDVIEIGTQEGVPQSEWGSVHGPRRADKAGAEGPGSPTSFMDLSDEDVPADTISEVVLETPRLPRRRGLPFSPSTPSLGDPLSPEELAEEDRRRKREKLAKLHRYLGSRVPTHLVLGPLNEGIPLPPPAPSPDNSDDDSDILKIRMRRRRSSSAAEFSRTWSDEIDRLKDDLNEREKALNVRRAVKMEKMFGVAPPQTLYHTRPTAAGATTSAAARKPRQGSPQSPSATAAFRFNQPAGGSKGKAKKGSASARPGTSDSSTPLVSADTDSLLEPNHDLSAVYLHFRHSLNSLNDIIDREDKASLAELHDYISGNQDDVDDLPATPMTTKAERRRSLPSRTSIASFSSDLSVAGPPEGSFQQRRRRAAKLTHFFGEDYRVLMSEILDSIEKGLEDERGRGTLRPDEVKDLQQKLVKLKTKRTSFSR